MRLLPRQQRCTLLIMFQLKEAPTLRQQRISQLLEYIRTRNHMKSVALLRDIKQAYLQRKIRGEDSDTSDVH